MYVLWASTPYFPLTSQPGVGVVKSHFPFAAKLRNYCAAACMLPTIVCYIKGQLLRNVNLLVINLCYPKWLTKAPTNWWDLAKRYVSQNQTQVLKRNYGRNPADTQTAIQIGIIVVENRSLPNIYQYKVSLYLPPLSRNFVVELWVTGQLIT